MERRPAVKNPISATVIALMACGALTGFASTAAARDREFSAAVHHIESTCHVHRSHRFLMWGVGMIVRVAHPEGVRSLRIALFEDQQFTVSGDDSQFTGLLERALTQSAARHAGKEAWQPLVRVWSRRDNERTYIYARPRGNDLELFVVSLEAEEAVVLKLRMNPDKLDEFMDEPHKAGRVYRETSAIPTRAHEPSSD
jgi:hypothetical protein